MKVVESIDVFEFEETQSESEEDYSNINELQRLENLSSMNETLKSRETVGEEALSASASVSVSVTLREKREQIKVRRVKEARRSYITL